MRKLMLVAALFGATSLAVNLGACGTSATESPSVDIDAGDGGVPTAATFTVGGTVTGLSGTGLVLQNNGRDRLSISANGAFAFALPLASGGPFTVTVEAQPSAPSQTCTVSSGTGTVGTTDVANVIVACATNAFILGGTVSGLQRNGLVLENNGGDALTLNAANNGPFSFATAAASGAT